MSVPAAERPAPACDDALRKMAEHSPVGIFHALPDGITTYVNPRGRAIADMIPGLGWDKSIHAEDRDRVLHAWGVARAARGRFEAEFRFLREDGSVVWVLGQAEPELDVAGNILGYVGAVTDVTQRRAEEEALREAHASLVESDKLYQAQAEASPAGLFRTDARGLNTYANARCCEIVGLSSPEEVRGTGWTRHLHPDDRARVAAEWPTQAAGTAGDPIRIECRYLHPDGRVVWAATQAVTLRDASGAVVGYTGTVTDVTRQRQAEGELRASEQRYQALAENSAVGIWQVTRDGWTTYINPAMRELLELEPGDDLAARRYHDFFTAESLARMSAEHSKRPAGVSSSYEVELLGARGGRRSVVVSGAPLFNADGELESLIGTFTDITQRQLTERALRESESRFRVMAETVPDIVYASLPDGTCEYINQRFYEYTGQPEGSGEAKGWVPLVHPDDLGELVEAWHRSAAGAARFEHEFRLRVADGSHRWFVTRARALREEGGAIVRWVGTSTDVDDLKRAAQRIRENESRLRLLVEQIPAVLWTVDRDLRFTSSRGAALATLGQLPDQVVGATLFEFFGTGDASFAGIATALRALEGISSNYELPWGGRVFHVHVEPLRAEDGSISGAVGVALDITERTQAEEALREANEQLEARVRSRTSQLEQAISDLAAQAAQRERAEEALRQSEEHFKELADSNRRLLQELDHRVRNNLAGLLGLLPLMRDQTEDVDAFAAAMEARLRAMAQIHHLLAEGDWQAVPLRTLARTLLDALGKLANCPGEVQINGPDVTISARQALPLSMILLEWFTNSCKYGAFSVPTGHITLRWELPDGDGRQRVSLKWTEAGGPPIREPVTPSLGTELVRSFASRELRGEAVLRFPEAGAEHRLEFPKETPGNSGTGDQAQAT